MIRVGSARSDLLFDKTIRASVLARLGLKENARVCLYVPTYRADEYERNRSMSIQLDMELLRKMGRGVVLACPTPSEFEFWGKCFAGG